MGRGRRRGVGGVGGLSRGGGDMASCYDITLQHQESNSSTNKHLSEQRTPDFKSHEPASPIHLFNSCGVKQQREPLI
jgi:hypothetical protein